MLFTTFHRLIYFIITQIRGYDKANGIPTLYQQLNSLTTFKEAVIVLRAGKGYTISRTTANCEKEEYTC